MRAGAMSRTVAWLAWASASLAACGGPQGHPSLPPPEYEEPLPPTPAADAAAPDAGTPSAPKTSG